MFENRQEVRFHRSGRPHTSTSPDPALPLPRPPLPPYSVRPHPHTGSPRDFPTPSPRFHSHPAPTPVPTPAPQPFDVCFSFMFLFHFPRELTPEESLRTFAKKVTGTNLKETYTFGPRSRLGTIFCPTPSTSKSSLMIQGDGHESLEFGQKRRSQFRHCTVVSCRTKSCTRCTSTPRRI